MYLVAVLDWHSRYVLSWRLSNTLDTEFCLAALDEALTTYGRPDIFNTDQGAQFTSHDFTSLLLENQIAISMDGRGRALDNVFIERLWRSLKYEDSGLALTATAAKHRVFHLQVSRETLVPVQSAAKPTSIQPSGSACC